MKIQQTTYCKVKIDTKIITILDKCCFIDYELQCFKTIFTLVLLQLEAHPMVTSFFLFFFFDIHFSNDLFDLQIKESSEQHI